MSPHDARKTIELHPALNMRQPLAEKFVLRDKLPTAVEGVSASGMVSFILDGHREE